MSEQRHAADPDPSLPARPAIVTPGRVVAMLVSLVGLYVVWPSLVAVFASLDTLRHMNPLWFAAMIGFEGASFASIWVRGGSLAGIAPEGNVGDGTKLLPGQKGAARIALMAEAPIVPVAVWGTQRRWPKEGFTFSRPARPTVAVVYGNPIHPEGDPRYRPHVQALTDRIMGDIEELLERARALSAPARSDPRRPGDDRRGVRPDV